MTNLSTSHHRRITKAERQTGSGAVSVTARLDSAGREQAVEAISEKIIREGGLMGTLENYLESQGRWFEYDRVMAQLAVAPYPPDGHVYEIQRAALKLQKILLDAAAWQAEKEVAGGEV